MKVLQQLKEGGQVGPLQSQWPCCASVLMLSVPCSCLMLVSHAHASYSCLMFVPHAHVPCSCPMLVYRVRAHTTSFATEWSTFLAHLVGRRWIWVIWQQLGAQRRPLPGTARIASPSAYPSRT